MMHERGEGVAAALANRLLQRIQDEIGPQRRGDAPADDPTGEDVNDEGDVGSTAQIGSTPKRSRC
jgi:hypothetical protein